MSVLGVFVVVVVVLEVAVLAAADKNRKHSGLNGDVLASGLLNLSYVYHFVLDE